MIIKTFAIGDLVQSQYRAKWHGVVTGIEEREGMNSIVSVKVFKDQHGNAMRKPIKRSLDAGWLILEK